MAGEALQDGPNCFAIRMSHDVWRTRPVMMRTTRKCQVSPWAACHTTLHDQPLSIHAKVWRNKCTTGVSGYLPPTLFQQLYDKRQNIPHKNPIKRYVAITNYLCPASVLLKYRFLLYLQKMKVHWYQIIFPGSGHIEVAGQRQWST